MMSTCKCGIRRVKNDFNQLLDSTFETLLEESFSRLKLRPCYFETWKVVIFFDASKSNGLDSAEKWAELVTEVGCLLG